MQGDEQKEKESWGKAPKKGSWIKEIASPILMSILNMHTHTQVDSHRKVQILDSQS